jgi:hypothetical protein
MLAELLLLRDQHVSDTNWRAIEAIDGLLKEVVVPVEEMRVALRSKAKEIPNFVAQAEFKVDLQPLLAYKPPLKLYVKDLGLVNPTVVREIAFTENGVTAVWLLERLLHKEGMIPQMRRLMSELVAAFPDGKLATEIVKTKEAPLALRFTVSYPLQTPAGILDID